MASKRKREPATRAPAEQEWNSRKELICSLYYESDLPEVMNSMEKDHKFIASKTQYERKFKEWGLRKNLKPEEWKYVLYKKRRRDNVTKDSQITLPGLEIPKEKIKKQESRYTYTELKQIFSPGENSSTETARINQLIELAGPNIPSTPEGISVFTPQSSVEETEVVPRAVQIDNIPYFDMDSLNWQDSFDSVMYNFDLEGLDFGNPYGTMEFGMLGHTSPSLMNTSDWSTSISSQQGIHGDFIYNIENLFSHENMDMQGRFTSHAYSINASPTSLAGPSTNNAGLQASQVFKNSTAATIYTAASTMTNSLQPPELERHSAMMNCRRDPSFIYQNTTDPYSYITRFNSLIDFIQSRFSPAKTFCIVRSIASIQQSFILGTRKLIREIPIIVEKWFMRTLLENDAIFRYRSLTPSIICCITGEIMVADIEFRRLTGWTSKLLYRQPHNENINIGRDSGSGRAGFPLPKKTVDYSQRQELEPRSDFLAELLDDDSVIKFYEELARVVFDGSRADVTAKYRLLTYQTQESSAFAAVENSNGNGGNNDREKGDIECLCSWGVQRDNFSVPIMIVMNFSPCT